MTSDAQNNLKRPFEVDADYLNSHLDELVDVTMADLTSAFLVLPRGEAFIEFVDFRDAYEVMKRRTSSFTQFNESTAWDAIRENSRTLCVLRAILGMTPPEWADLAREERDSDISQSYARSLDRECRQNPDYVARVEASFGARPDRISETPPPVSLSRIGALVSVAVQYIREGAPPMDDGVVHRLAKFDTERGSESLAYAVTEQ